MRKRHILASALLATVAVNLSPAAAQSNTPSVQAALALRPVQGDVDYEKPDATAAAKCRVESLSENGWTGFLVLAEDGHRLRRFADTNGDREIDLWCYYDSGVEVYRDVDADFNRKADQYRWLGTAGSRWGLDQNEDGKIDSWKSISAEETSAELVAAIAAQDKSRFERLLISPSEIDSLQLGDELTKKITDARELALREFTRFASEQKSLETSSKWVHFAASRPGVVPAGSFGSQTDITVYENAVAMFDTKGTNGQLAVGTMVQVGSLWRIINLPQLTGEGSIADSSGFFFSGSSLALAQRTTSESMAGDIQKLVSDLEKIDLALQSSSGSAAAKLHDQRADCLEGIIAASEPAQRAGWIRQLVDTVGAAIQDGSYPNGIDRLKALSGKLRADERDQQAYVDFQVISSEYALRLSQVQAQKDFPAVQEWWLTSLEKFVNEHDKTAEAAQAMLQLGLSKEFEDDEKAALQWYTRVASGYSTTDTGRKAAGAVRRLESVGREIPLTGSTLDNKPFDLARLKGKPVVIHYWATWCEPCKQDMKVLRELQARYQRAGLQIVGVNVDGVRSDAIKFANEAKIAWPTLFAEGGLDASPLASTLGVQTLPTMLLIDAKGKVVRHNIAASQLDEEIDRMIRASK